MFEQTDEFDVLRDLDFSAFQSLTRNPLETVKKHQDGQKRVTLSPAKMQSCAIKSRSKKVKQIDDLDISFEKTILEAHQKALKNLFCHYNKKIFRILQLSEKEIWQEKSSKKLIPKQIEDQELSALLNQCPYLSKNQKLQLVKDFNDEEELTKLLFFCLEHTDQRIKDDILCLFVFVWEHYITASNPLTKFKSIIESIRKTIFEEIDDLIFQQQFQHLTLLSQSDEFPEKLKNTFIWFLHGIVETIVLVIEGYFDNPFETLDEEDIEDDEVYIRKFAYLCLEDEESYQKQPDKKVKREDNSLD